MFCPNCGKKFQGVFCPACGTKLVQLQPLNTEPPVEQAESPVVKVPVTQPLVVESAEAPVFEEPVVESAAEKPVFEEFTNESVGQGGEQPSSDAKTIKNPLIISGGVIVFVALLLIVNSIFNFVVICRQCGAFDVSFHGREYRAPICHFCYYSDISDESVEIENSDVTPQKKPVADKDKNNNSDKTESKPDKKEPAKEDSKQEPAANENTSDEVEEPAIYFSEIHGLSYDDATEKLDNAGVDYYHTYVYSSTYDFDEIVNEARGGWTDSSYAYSGDTVELLVSYGSLEDGWYYDEPDYDSDNIVTESETVYDVYVYSVNDPILDAEGITWEEFVEKYDEHACGHVSEMTVDETLKFEWANTFMEVFCYETVTYWRYDYEVWD